jgi:hypothetical protein
MIKLSFAAAVAATLSLASAAHAQMGPNADTDGDGFISRAEQTEAAGRRFDRMDANGDGFIDAAERKAMMDRMRARPTGNTIGGQDPLAGLDTDGDGKISKAEMAAQAMVRFDRLDADKDGKLSADERKAGRPAGRI